MPSFSRNEALCETRKTPFAQKMLDKQYSNSRNDDAGDAAEQATTFPRLSFRVLRNSNSSTIQWDGVKRLRPRTTLMVRRRQRPASGRPIRRLLPQNDASGTFQAVVGPTGRMHAAEENIPEITLAPGASEAVPLIKACQGRNVFWTLPQPLMGDLLRQLPSV